MSLLQRLLVLPLLSPLLAVLLLGAVNPRPWVALRLLTWVSPAWPLGAWIAGAAAAGAGLSAAATALALQGGSSPLLERRQVRRRGSAPWSPPWDDNASGDSPEREAPRREAPVRESGRATGAGWAGPTRGAAEPPPTVSVPFRVIRKGSSASPPRSEASVAAVGDGWDAAPTDDW